jgi:predicted RNA binding protein YcfA (HicA-like mRNA interferase family)
MKVREIIKIVEADGWRHVKTTGSHRQFKHPTKPGRVTIAGKQAWMFRLGR